MALSMALAPSAWAKSATMSKDEINRRYDKLLEDEEFRTSNENFTERLASGLAALAIGLYGYYNDDRGLLTRVVYSATKTAGIVMVSSAMHDAAQPSLLLLTDSYLHRRGALDLARFKRTIVSIERKRQIGEYRRLAYSSAILALLYAYDGYRERESEIGLKNAFYFLSFNFAMISGANFYRLMAQDLPTESASQRWSTHIAVLPYPTISIYF